MLEEFAEGLLELAQLLGISAAENNLNAMQDPAMGKAILLYLGAVPVPRSFSLPQFISLCSPSSTPLPTSYLAFSIA